MEKKEKKIEFSEEIDNSINGYAVAFTFIGISIFLINNLEYFGNKIVSIVILSIFSIIGVLGTFSELEKNTKIKGLGDLIVGLLFFSVWLLIYFFGKSIVANVLGFIIMIIGVYGTLLGIIKLLVSIFYQKSQNEKKIKNIGINSLNALSAMGSFVLVIFNIIKIALEIKTIQ